MIIKKKKRGIIMYKGTSKIKHLCVSNVASNMTKANKIHICKHCGCVIHKNEMYTNFGAHEICEYCLDVALSNNQYEKDFAQRWVNIHTELCK